MFPPVIFLFGAIPPERLLPPARLLGRDTFLAWPPPPPSPPPPPPPRPPRADKDSVCAISTRAPNTRTKIRNSTRFMKGTPVYWLPATRCTSILSKEGWGSPLSVRFCDSQVNLLSSTFVSTFSAVERLPSGNTLEARISQSSPLLIQVDSPKPPLLSKIQDRICWRTGSQPIISHPSVTDWSPPCTLIVRTRKFLSPAQLILAWTVWFSVLSC